MMSDPCTVPLYVTLVLTFGFTVSLVFMPFHTRLSASERASANVMVDVNSKLRDLSPFWRSTGFCPPLPHESDAEWFLADDMMQNLKYIGAIPGSGIEQVRIHWLLDSVKVTGLTPSGLPLYNFTSLDALMDMLWSNELRPGFEVMGNPSNLFTDLENITQLLMWRSLVQDIVHRYADKYGISEIIKWNFETWNEPRPKSFDALNMTIQGFLNYYDATVDALKTYNSSIKIGGPGGACKSYSETSFCWSLLNHIVHGRNAITKKTGTSIDYISIHKKGTDPSNTDVMIAEETSFHQVLKEDLPELSKVPIYNDEADPLEGWNKDMWWRADATYAAMVTKIITRHQNKWMANDSDMNFALLSNDNGFLSYNPYFFTQRTLLARFQMNNTKPPHVQFIRKPVYSVMGMLSYLGGNQLTATVDLFPERSEKNSQIGVIATSHSRDPTSAHDSNQYTVIVYNSADTQMVTSESNVTITMQNFKTTESMRVVLFQLDNNHGNPYSVWLKAGKPHTPSADVLKQMREQEEPLYRILPPQSAVTGVYCLVLPLPGVTLLHFCEQPQSPPGQVTNVSVHYITKGYTLITWSDSHVKTKCIKTYEVQCSQSQGIYHRINSKDTVFNSFVFASDESSKKSCHFRVRAVDYWDRPGNYSKPTIL